MNGRSPKMHSIVKIALVQYTKKHYPKSAKKIIYKAEKIYPRLYAKMPDIGGKKNMLASNMDMMLTFIAFYEASNHRIDGKSINEVSDIILGKISWVSKIFNINKPYQLRMVRKLMYGLYVPYAKKVDAKKENGEWGNTWSMAIDPKSKKEGVSFDLIGCPLVDYAKKYGYEEIVPYMCLFDHKIAALFHARIIRTHTVATGSESCDYWYVPDRGKTARKYKDLKKI